MHRLDLIMTAITANFVSSPGPAPSEAFGGLIDLSRALLRSDPSTTVVCETCRTINKDSALFCKGCDGKLPAFYATGAVADSTAHAPGLEEERTPAMLTLAASVLGFTAALGTMLALLGLWYGGGATVEAPPVSTAVSLPAVTPVHVASVVPVTLPALDASYHAAASKEDSAATALEDEQTATSGVKQARGVRKAWAQPPEQRVAFRRSAQGPLALCDGRNFIAHAVCVNNRCAQPGSAQLSQCKQPLRQRRQDEARRNLFLMN